MCQFVSWIEHDNKNYFLTEKDLVSKEGRAFLKANGTVDIQGHGAIRALYPELGGLGIDKEVSNFKSPENFPKDIVKAIKNGDFYGVGICLDILNSEGTSESDKISQSARAKYNKIRRPAWAEYNKIRQSALDEYNKIRRPAWAEYNKIRQSALAEYNKIRQPAFWEIAKQKKYRAKKWL